MDLKDLFVSNKQVHAVEFRDPDFSISNPLYTNRYRAQKAASETESKSESTITDDMTTWNAEGESMSDWRVVNDEDAFTTKHPANSSDGDSRVVSKWSSPYKNNKQQWISDMANAYRKVGLSNNAIRNLIAKNALESGWGRSAQGAYNFGNITPGSKWKGKYVIGRDTDGKGNPIQQLFRSYDSLDHYVKDEIEFLTRLYDFDPNDDSETFVNKLQGGNSGKRYYAAAGGKYIPAFRNFYKLVNV